MFGLSSSFLTKAKTLQGGSPDTLGLDDLFGQNADATTTPFAPFGASLPYQLRSGAAAPAPSGASRFTVFNGGITFVLSFTAADDPTANFENDIINAAKLLSAAVHDKITVNLTIGFGETGGDPLSGGSASAGPSSGQFESYSDVRSKLLAHAAAGDLNYSSAPSGSSINDQYNVAQSQVIVWNAELKSLGYIPATQTGEDGSAGFSKTISDSVMVGVGLHELSHALGRVPNGPQPDIMEFFRYTAPGVRFFSNNTGTASYFSLDGGATRLANYGVSSDPSDFLNDSLTTNDKFDEFYNPSTVQTLTHLDLTQLDILGFDTQTVVKKYVAFDFNGDGFADILWRNTSGALSIWESNGTGGFARLGAGAAATSWSVVGVGDFNGDGDADILWHNTNGSLYFWNSNATGGFTKTVKAGLATSWSVVGVGDFNGDGKTDILWRNTHDALDLWVNNGVGGFVKTLEGGLASSWSVVGVGDFNCDGDADILWRNANGALNLWESRGAGGFTELGAGAAATSWSVAGVGDFNGDGKADLLLRNANGALNVWDSDGSGGYLSKTAIGNAGTDFHVVGVADVNGDHMSDFVTRNAAGSTTLWASNGAGGFARSHIGNIPISWSIQGG